VIGQRGLTTGMVGMLVCLWTWGVVVLWRVFSNRWNQRQR